MNSILDIAVSEMAPTVGTVRACEVMGRPRASHYRAKNPTPANKCVDHRPVPASAYTAAERAEILAVLNSDTYADSAPAQIYGRLLDQGVYLCSIRTMYRILADNTLVRERRHKARHPKRLPPRLRATGPNQVWTWDITRLPLLDGGRPLHAYVLLDLFSRFSPGWVVAERETADLAVELIETACEAQGVAPGTLHADRGAAMTSKSVAELLIDMGTMKSHSRPRTSNDNAFSEAQFKTVKHHHTYPKRFDGISHARSWINDFMHAYNTRHLHSGIGLMTPATIHYGQADTVIGQRQTVLDAAYTAHPERFRNRPPKAPRNPTQVWINQPTTTDR